MSKTYNSEKALKRAAKTHMYVVEYNGIIIGTGSIGSYWGSKTENCLFSIFVLPEYHNQGIGKAIMQTLENDELLLESTRIEIPAFITACGFYERMGYLYKNGIQALDDGGITEWKNSKSILHRMRGIICLYESRFVGKINSAAHFLFCRTLICNVYSR